jgi:hypothetical protein
MVFDTTSIVADDPLREQRIAMYAAKGFAGRASPANGRPEHWRRFSVCRLDAVHDAARVVARLRLAA